MRRQRIDTASPLFGILERMVLEPEVTAYAREQGLERQPGVVAQLEQRREALLVQHLYADSVEAFVHVDEAMRKQFYTAHQVQFVSRERVRYAVIPRATEAGADSVIRRLDAHETPAAILAADSISGMRGGSIRDLLEGQPHNYRAMLFEELRPGQSTKLYLGKDQLWAVMHVISHDSGKPMAYEQVRDIVDQSVENTESERLLNALLARLRARHSIESHPEWVMRFRLSDPVLDWNGPNAD